MRLLRLKSIQFQEMFDQQGYQIPRKPLEALQINVGKRCNQTCRHCHVDAGPTRTEVMTRKTAERIVALLAQAPAVHTVDVTGGAPELHPEFRYLVERARALGKDVIDRCNLTVFFEPGQKETPFFLRHHQVQIIASLPCYSKENVERQRGHGVFDKSIKALRLLNNLGYGKEGSGLTLDLVYNPTGPSLPPPQNELENDYKRELKDFFGIEFNRLLTITNMPIQRFLADLRRNGSLEGYMDLLVQNFNPQAADGIMCRYLISIGWDGQIYDCDFNQMLEIPLGRKKRTVWEIDSFDEFRDEAIAFEDHCYGCTAGAGSSCGWVVVKGE